MRHESLSPPDLAERAYHGQVVRRAIEALDAADRHLTVDELAAAVGLSTAHFTRTFTRWAGIGPARLQQYLALGHAKALLAERFTTLAAADGAGLSGTGRLHDLFIRWEAMTPGEWAEGGATTIRHGRFDGPFGPSLVMATDRGICGIAFLADATEAEAMADMTARWPAATYVEDPEGIRPWAEAALSMSGEAPAHLIGAPFQIKVWEALMRIPTGHVTTYGEIAAAIGNPGAVRAVGTAVGRNPVSLLIPCHRAIRKSGGLGGYHWGLPTKRAILAWEAASLDSGTSLPTEVPDIR